MPNSLVWPLDTEDELVNNDIDVDYPDDDISPDELDLEEQLDMQAAYNKANGLGIKCYICKPGNCIDEPCGCCGSYGHERDYCRQEGVHDCRRSHYCPDREPCGCEERRAHELAKEIAAHAMRSSTANVPMYQHLGIANVQSRVEWIHYIRNRYRTGLSEAVAIFEKRRELGYIVDP